MADNSGKIITLYHVSMNAVKETSDSVRVIIDLPNRILKKAKRKDGTIFVKKEQVVYPKQGKSCNVTLGPAKDRTTVYYINREKDDWEEAEVQMWELMEARKAYYTNAAKQSPVIVKNTSSSRIVPMRSNPGYSCVRLVLPEALTAYSDSKYCYLYIEDTKIVPGKEKGCYDIHLGETEQRRTILYINKEENLVEGVVKNEELHN